ncbi:M14 family zinc carboxypeptidase [Lignipirellula cremea]|uniref:Zinc carboxypeptidase n=1 Tax=Lignipirellula cremea TaxID=2528010 RepID=A0A518DYR6_9BACT|nr:M14 family zinc carboxypeptidase [Lignipirellula cremea]QDU96992.1 Zinc carboxypeptidase [Lignipirellula cremea]
MMTLRNSHRLANVALACLLGVCLANAALAADEVPPGAVTIRSDFPGGNIEILKNEGDQVQAAPDLRGDKPWFYWYLEATAIKPGRVNFTFPDKVVGFKNGAIGLQGPAISTDGGQSWKWMGTETVEGPAFYYDFSKADETVRFAVTIPYLQTDLAAFVKRNAANPHLQTTTLTRSQGDRPVEQLRIGKPGPGVQPMLVTGRHHAAESMASFVLEGFLQEAMSDSPAGAAFRKKYLLYAVPLVDKDGVEEGDQGKNRVPHDHNRDYGDDSIYPEIRAIKQLDKEVHFAFSLDFHCPTLVMPDHQVMYFVGARNHPENNYQNVAEFAGWIKKGLPPGAPSGPHVWLRDAETPTPMNSHYFGFKPGVVMAATLEFPFAPPGKVTDPDSCREYGRVVLRAWVETHFQKSDTSE